MSSSHSHDIALKVLEQAARKADSAEVVYQDSESHGVNFQDNKLKSVSGSEVRGIGLRVIHKGRLGFSSTSDLARTDQLISAALASAQFGQEAKFAFPGNPAALPEVMIFDPKVPGVRMQDAADLVQSGIAKILDASPESHCSGGVGAEAGHTVLCNTAGLFHEETSSEYGMSIGAFLVRGESFLSIDEGESSSKYSADMMRHVDRVISWLKLAEKEVHLSSGALPVIFTPHALGFLLETFEMNTNGKMVQKGASVLAKRVGEKILGGEVTISDDPLADYASGSMAIDAEGIPARKNVLFDKGVLKGFLFDLQTAGMMGAQPTGNGMRGYSSAPTPGMTNIRMAGGSTPYAKILSGIKRGLLLHSALGAGQSNMLAGDFSVTADMGFLIENGEIVGRVKDCMLAGNAFAAFNRIRAISAETEWHGAAELPYVCFDDMSIAGR